MLLHCPPSPVFARDDSFAELDRQKRLGKIADYGVSIEKTAEGLQAMEYDIAAIEVVFNLFRLKPLSEAQMRGVEEIYDRYLRRIIHPQW